MRLEGRLDETLDHAGHAAALRFFTQPMTEQTFDLSVETVRWEVYTQEGQRRTDLLPDGDAGYTGLSAPG